MRLWNSFCVPKLCWRANELICSTSFGAKFHVRPAQFVENRICFFGEWEPNVTALFQKLVLPGDTVIDVGANIGYFTVLSSILTGSEGRVYSFEPSAETRSRLLKNLALNGIQNVHVVAAGAWNEQGNAKLNTHPVDRGGSSIRVIDDSSEFEEISLTRIDTTVKSDEWSNVRLIKIDVEGAECHAAQGMQDILNAQTDIVVIIEVENPKLQDFGKSAAELLSFFTNQGFYAYRIPNNYDASEYANARRSFEIIPISEAPNESSYVLLSRKSGGLKSILERKGMNRPEEGKSPQ